MKKMSAFLIILLLAILPDTGSAQEKSTFVTIGTGGITGVYYPTGRAIAKMLNKKKKEYGIRVTVESTGGSVFNINAIMEGDLEFGIIQSDSQFKAMKGMAEWKEKGPQKELRTVFSIHPEAVTLVTSSDSGIKSIADLKGKKVNIGNLGSGHRQNAIDALNTVGIDYTKDLKVEAIKASEAAGLLQDKNIDAFFYTVGHPSGAINEATSGARKVFIADIIGVESLIAKFPYYHQTTIPMKLYPGAENTQDVKTFGVKATLCTSSKVPDDIVYAITKEVFDNLEEFKTLHPAYGTLTRENMLTGLFAPIHPGAMKYFKEAGLK